jgi:hypothetical protein
MGKEFFYAYPLHFLTSLYSNNSKFEFLILDSLSVKG